MILILVVIYASVILGIRFLDVIKFPVIND
jgi:hypothetical protein